MSVFCETRFEPRFLTPNLRLLRLVINKGFRLASRLVFFTVFWSEIRKTVGNARTQLKHRKKTVVNARETVRNARKRLENARKQTNKLNKSCSECLKDDQTFKPPQKAMSGRFPETGPSFWLVEQN